MMRRIIFIIVFFPVFLCTSQAQECSIIKGKLAKIIKENQQAGRRASPIDRLREKMIACLMNMKIKTRGNLLYYIEHLLLAYDGSEDYNDSRIFPEYVIRLGENYLDELYKLKSDSHIIFTGGGNLLHVHDYLIEGRYKKMKKYIPRSVYAVNPYADRGPVLDDKEVEKKMRKLLEKDSKIEKANVTVVSYAKPESGSENYLRTDNNKPLYETGKFNYILGRPFKDISKEEITAEFGKADLIVDVMDTLAYTPYFSADLNKMLEVLKRNGKLLMGVELKPNDNHFEDSIFRNQVLTKSGKTIPLVKWVVKQLGKDSAKLEKHSVEGDNETYTFWTLEITKNKKDMKVPDLIIYRVNLSTNPPIRYFKEI